MHSVMIVIFRNQISIYEYIHKHIHTHKCKIQCVSRKMYKKLAKALARRRQTGDVKGKGSDLSSIFFVYFTFE